MDNVKLWEIRRYIDSVKVQNTTAVLPRNLFKRLSEATTSVESATVTAAILYGMRVSAAISAATANQTDFSRYILDRIKGGAVHG